MAIVFTDDINAFKLRMAYNNDVINYYSNTSTTIQKWSEIVARDTEDGPELFRARLYPAPGGKFYFNFKPYITALINTKNFADTLDPQINALEVESYIYGGIEGLYKKLFVEITVMHGDNTEAKVTNTLTWIAGVQQLGDVREMLVPYVWLLSPFKSISMLDHHLKYWEGYPFDISIHGGQSTVLLRNETNLLQQSFTLPARLSRIVFSDGRTDVTIESLLPLIEGYNNIRLSQNSGSRRYITLEKVPYMCGVYLKWLNPLGGYSYWLFEDIYAVDRSSKQLGEINTDVDNLENSFGRVAQLGKESQDVMKLLADSITPDERTVLETIIDSPKIYLFTGQPFSRNSYHNWVEVSLKTSNVRVKNPKEKLTNFLLDFELPMRYTQTL